MTLSIKSTSFQPIDGETLFLALRNLGLKAQDIVLIISRPEFSQQVLGGSQTIIAALLKAVGENGTLLFEAFNRRNSEPSYWQAPAVMKHFLSATREFLPISNIYYDDINNELSENIRKRPQVVYSFHPRFSYLALGPLASALCQGRKMDYAFGLSSPLQRLYELHGKVLFLGQVLSESEVLCLAQYQAQRFSTLIQGAQVETAYGTKWRKYLELNYKLPAPTALSALFEKQGLLHYEPLGNLKMGLIEMVALTDGAKVYYQTLY